MALNTIVLSNGFYGFRQLSEVNEWYKVHKLSCLVTATAFRAGSKGAIAMSLKCCSLDHVGRKTDDEVGKAHTMSPLPQLAHESNGSLKLVNGHSARSPLEFSEHLLTEKIVVAVDVDEGCISNPSSNACIVSFIFSLLTACFDDHLLGYDFLFFFSLLI